MSTATRCPSIRIGQTKVRVCVPPGIVIGVVEGDVHDMGKNIVAAVLEACGFRVTDLGKNVPNETFLEAIEAERPEIVAQLRAILSKQPEAKPQVRAAASPAGKKAGAASSKPKQDRAAMFAKRDKDGDGRLTREEFLIGQPDPDEAPKRFLLFDTDKDGALSREEFITGGKPKR